MPDGPMPSPGGAPGGQPGGAPPAAGGGGQPPQGGQGGGGGGLADAVTQIDGMLYKINEALSKSPQASSDVKSAAQDALSAFRTFEQALVKAAGGQPPGAGGGQEPDGDEAGGTTTTQQGGRGSAVPMTHQSMR